MLIDRKDFEKYLERFFDVIWDTDIQDACPLATYLQNKYDTNIFVSTVLAYDDNGNTITLPLWAQTFSALNTTGTGAEFAEMLRAID